MDKFLPTLLEGATKLGVSLAAESGNRLLAYATQLLRWNEKVNLTAITDPIEVIDKHLLDSLAVLPELGSAGTLLDLGAGAGLPGIPLAVVRPALKCTLVDAVAKKVAFMKTGAVAAGVTTQVRVIHRHVVGDAANEGIEAADVVISRAFMDVAPFVQLARSYARAGGRVVCMVGQMPDSPRLEAWAAAANVTLTSWRTWSLPISNDPRGVVVFTVPRETPAKS